MLAVLTGRDAPPEAIGSRLCCSYVDSLFFTLLEQLRSSQEDCSP